MWGRFRIPLVVTRCPYKLHMHFAHQQLPTCTYVYTLDSVCEVMQIISPQTHTQRERERERECVYYMYCTYTHTHNNIILHKHMHARISNNVIVHVHVYIHLKSIILVWTIFCVYVCVCIGRCLIVKKYYSLLVKLFENCFGIGN